MQDLKDIIQRAQQGDLNAFDLVIVRFRDMAVAYAYSMLRDFPLTEEASQEALTISSIFFFPIRDSREHPTSVHLHCRQTPYP